MRHVIGVDAGGTKTICAVAREDGTVLGLGRSGGTNFQTSGVQAAREETARAVEAALRAAGVREEDIALGYYGVAGADREVDFATVRGFLRRPHPGGGELLLENDTTLALRAGTEDGVGVALIAGTGSNAIGFNREGRRMRVGGMGRLSGDYGSAVYLGERAVLAAWKGEDGRGPRTSLRGLIRDALHLENLEDIVAFDFADSADSLDIDRLAPLVFTAAAAGDEVARELLNETGREVARGALVIIEALFDPGEEVTLVMAGSVFQRGSDPALVEAVSREVTKVHPAVRIVRLAVDPIVGAVLLALDNLGHRGDRDLARRVVESYQALKTEER